MGFEVSQAKGPVLALALLTAGAAAAGEPPRELLSYGFVRTVDGEVAIVQDLTGDELSGQRHQPVMTGDRVSVLAAARVEILLPDRNLLRVQGDSELVLERLAYSADQPDELTQIRLERGLAQIVVTDTYLGEEPPRIDTPNARLYLQGVGEYLVQTGEGPATRVVVREGSAETITQRGSWLLQAGEDFLVEGEELANTSIQAAPPRGDLETWGDELQAQLAAVPHLDSGLAYSASTMDGHGSWLEVDGDSAWQPHVDGDWQPYRNGSWSYSPSGLTWVSNEPWGWVPYHYGYWDLTPRFGWVWRPGNLYSPAWVSWYWGPSYVGWLPTGPYFGYYPSYGSRYRYGPWSPFGNYGWAGGPYYPHNYWTFCPTPYFGTRWRTPRRGTRPPSRGAGARIATDITDVVGPVPGIVTADTGGISPKAWDQGPEAISRLIAARSITGRTGSSSSEPSFLAPLDVSPESTVSGLQNGATSLEPMTAPESWRDRLYPASPAWPSYGGLLWGDRWRGSRISRTRPTTGTPLIGSFAETPGGRPPTVTIPPTVLFRSGPTGRLFSSGRGRAATNSIRVYRPQVRIPSIDSIPRGQTRGRPSGVRPGTSQSRPSYRTPSRSTGRTPTARRPATRSPAARPSARPSTARPQSSSPPARGSGRPPSN